MQRDFVLLLAIYLQSTSSFAQEALQCNFPEPGQWTLSPGQTQVGTVPGGHADSRFFELVVEDCGARLVTYNMGAPELGAEQVFHRGSSGNYLFEAEYQGINFTTIFEMATNQALIGRGSMGSHITTPLVAEYIGPSEAPRRSALCDCQPFRQRLRDAIASQEFFKSIYSDPRYSLRPANLDPAIAWSQPTQERLIDLVTNDTRPVPFEEAVQNFAALTNAPAATEGAPIAPAEDNRNHHNAMPSNATAITNSRTCEVTLVQPANGCGADILNDASLAHENFHRETCQPIQRNALADFGAPTYPLTLYDDPAFAARNEVKAYSIGIAYINDTFQSMCGVSLD